MKISIMVIIFMNAYNYNLIYYNNKNNINSNNVFKLN